MLSPSAAHGCAFEVRCCIAFSAGCPDVVESEALPAFAAQDLRVMDRTAIGALIVIGLVPLFLHHPGHTATSLLSLTTCKLLTVLRVPGSSQHHHCGSRFHRSWKLAGMGADFVLVGELTYNLKRCAPCGGNIFLYWFEGRSHSCLWLVRTSTIYRSGLYTDIGL